MNDNDHNPTVDLVCRAIAHGWYIIYEGSYYLLCHASTRHGLLIEDGKMMRV